MDNKTRARLAGRGLPVVCGISRVPVAAEVNAGTMDFVFPFKPTVIAVLVQVTATPGISKAWDGAFTVTKKTVTLDNAGNTDWAATDTVTVLALDAG